MQKLGNIHFKRKEYSTASSFLRESVKIFSEHFGYESIEVAHTLLDTASVFNKLSKHKNVIYCCGEVITIYNLKYAGRDSEYTFGVPLAKCFGLKAISHDSFKETTAAVECFEKSIQISNLYLQNLAPIHDLNAEERDSFMFFASLTVKKAKLHERIDQEIIAMRHYTGT